MEDREKDGLYEEDAPAGEAGGVPVAPEGGLEPAAPEDAAELRNRLAYMMAEFDNFRKRAAREREALQAYGNERLLLAILPFLDNLERAMGQGGASSDTILAGVRIAYDSLLAELGKFGLEQLSSEGKPFDPSLHEAIGAIPGTGAPEGAVLSESRKGYLLNGRLLRPAQVLVAAAPVSDDAYGQEG